MKLHRQTRVKGPKAERETTETYSIESTGSGDNVTVVMTYDYFFDYPGQYESRTALYEISGAALAQFIETHGKKIAAHAKVDK